MTVDHAALAFVALVALLALNRLVVAVAGSIRWRVLHWTVQVLNLAGAVYLVVLGLPGLPPGLRIIDWFVALLFLFHVVENHVRRGQAERAPQTSDLDQRRRAIRERLRRSGSPGTGTPPQD